MIKPFLLAVLLLLSLQASAQTQQKPEEYLMKTLSYQHLKYKSEGKQSQINIYQVEIKNCTLSYPILIKKGNKTQRYTIRIGLYGIDALKLTKSREGHPILFFTTKGKSIIKELPNGEILHEKSQFIPLKTADEKVFQALKKMKKNCSIGK